MTPATVSVIVPAYREERWIDACLSFVEGQDFPHHRMEVVVVVDGASDDATESRARARLAHNDFSNAVVVKNGGRTTPANLNVGLAAATGDIVCRVDAHSLIPPNYVRRCVELLTARPDVSVVGGTPVAVPSRPDAQAVGVARAFNNRYAMGWSRYHRGAHSGPSDTVYLGAFRRTELVEAGGWNEAFPTNQDFELNRRMARRGVVWFDDGLEVGQVTRASVLALHRHFTRFGRAKAGYWRMTGDRPRPRQLVMLTAPLVVAGLVTGAFVTGRPARRSTVVAVAALAVAAIEMRGAARPRGGMMAHGWSALALAAAVGGWLRGVWSGLLGRSR